MRLKHYFSIAAMTMAILSPTGARASEDASAFSAKMAKVTIGSMNRFKEGVNVQIPDRARSSLGGTSRINCPAGATPAACIPMAIWNTSLGTGNLTPDRVAKLSGNSIDGNRSLAAATPWLSKLKIGEVLAADPSMRNMPVTAADGTRTVLGRLGHNSKLLGEVIDLRQTSISQFPQIQTVQFKKFPGLSQLPITNIPGLPNLKIIDMPGYQVPGLVALMKLDLVRKKEKNIHHMVMSDGGRYKCNENCDYGEFHPWIGLPYLRGAKIISGDSLSVNGGHGVLGLVNGGREPAGVEVDLGAGGVKFVLRNVNSQRGSVTLNMNFRACGWLVGCTPYFVGIPLFDITEKNNWFPILAPNASIHRKIKMPKL